METAAVDDLPVLLEIERASYSHPWTRRNFEGELRAASGPLPGGARSGGGGRGRPRAARLLRLPDGGGRDAPHEPDRGAAGSKAAASAAFFSRWPLDLAARRGCPTALLEVRESNTRALALYRTAGFVQAGRRPGYYNHPREDALLLARPLAAGCRQTDLEIAPRRVLASHHGDAVSAVSTPEIRRYGGANGRPGTG